MVARRSVVQGIAALPLATILADAKLAHAAAGDTQMVSITTANGKTASGALAMPDTKPAGTVILIHEWWGLNDQIKVMATQFAKAGYIAVAADLYNGKIATTPEDARAMTKSVVPEDATDALTSWASWLKNHEASNGKVATCGWCFGGGWSLNASIATPVDATVVYYGRVNKDAAALKNLNAPVLGHFGTEDKFINQDMVTGFEKAMDEAGKEYTNHWYSANHAFANPTTARYDEEDAATAWTRTLDFLGKHLG